MTANKDDDLEAFCRSSFPSLVGMLSLWCNDPYLAQELAQETLARVCRDWKRVRQLDHPEAWTRKVAMNLAFSSYRRRRIERRALKRSETEPMNQPDGATSVELRALVAGLPKRQRTAVVLRYFCDLSYAEIGAIMDAPESTVKSLVSRSLKRLRESESYGREASGAR